MTQNKRNVIEYAISHIKVGPDTSNAAIIDAVSKFIIFANIDTVTGLEIASEIARRVQ